MAKTFSGILDGERFTATLANLTSTVSLDILSWGTPPAFPEPNASFTISLVDGCTDVVAPYGAVFRATNLVGFNVSEPSAPLTGAGSNVYDPTHNRVSYFWDFGDPSYTPLQTPNIPTVWRDLNAAKGKQTAHVYHTPGSYTVTCYAFDEAGNWGIATYTFGSGGQQPAIADPNTYFAGANTVCLSKAGNFTGAPAGSTQVTTVAAAHSALRTRMNAGNRSLRLLTRAGEEYVDEWFFSVGTSNPGFPGGTGYDYRNGMKGLHIGRFGSGARPIVRRTVDGPVLPLGFPERTDTRQFVISDIDFRGPWDSTTETGLNLGIGDAKFWGSTVIFTRCRFDGFSDQPFDKRISRGMFVHDCEVTNWANYGFGHFGVQDGIGPILVLIGNRVHQHVDALNGVNQGLPVEGVAVDASQEPSEMGNRHGCLRQSAYQSVAYCNSFFTRNGWFGSTEGLTLAQTAEQANERFHHNEIPNLNRHYHVRERNSYEGGDNPVSFGWGGTGPTQTSVKNVLVDGNLVVGVSGTYNPLIAGNLPGTDIRNNYLYRRDLVRTHPNLIRDDIRWQINSGSTEFLPVRIFNNTLLSEIASSRMEGFYAPITQEGAHQYTITNNIIRVVNRPAFANAGVLPLGTSALPGFVCQHKGGRWGFPPIRRFINNIREGGAGNVAVGEWISVPYPNYTGNGGRGAFQVTQAMVLGNSGQFHQISVCPGARGHPWKRMTNGDGVTFEFTPTAIRIRNDGTRPPFTQAPNPARSTWNSTDYVYILLDLRDYLMDFLPGTGQFGLTIPLPAPGVGSSARATGTAQPRSIADFSGTRKPGSLTNTGTFVPGSASQGAFEPV
jgi:hypothetical protein